jgi:DNA primase
MRDGGAGRRAGAGPADDWVERVRAASDIAEIVGQTVALKRTGRNLVGLCPFHKEKTPSFSVNPERQFFHCFGCKMGGDVFRFVQETEKVGFLEAVEMLSRRAGIPVPERRGGGDRGARGRLLEALEAAAAAYEQWLGDPRSGAGARAYLEGRGLTRETQRAFRLGLAPEGWENLVQRLRGKIEDEVLVQAGLAARRETGRGGLYDRFRHRLMVPLVAPGGGVVGFGARALAEGDAPKYLNSPETPVYHKGAFLFALEQARRQTDPGSEMIVVEGYFDAIALHQAGLRNTVATSGTALTTEQARLLKRIVPRVVLTYDGDAAGQEAMMRSLGVLLAEGLDVLVADLPSGEDPDTLLRGGGLEAWNDVRGRAADPVAFIQRHVLRGPSGGRDPRERALHAVVELGVRVTDPIRRQELVERASQVFRQPERVIARAIALRRSGQPGGEPIAASIRADHAALINLERAVLQAILLCPEEFSYARGEIDPGAFEDPVCRSLAESLWTRGTPADSGPAATLARELVTQGSAYGDRDWRAALHGLTLRMGIRHLQRERRALLEGVREGQALPGADRIGQIDEMIRDREQLIATMEKQAEFEGEDPMPFIRSMAERNMRRSDPKQETN